MTGGQQETAAEVSWTDYRGIPGFHPAASALIKNPMLFSIHQVFKQASEGPGNKGSSQLAQWPVRISKASKIWALKPYSYQYYMVNKSHWVGYPLIKIVNLNNPRSLDDDTF